MLDGKVARLRALEDLVDERGGAPVEVASAGTVRDQAACLGVFRNAGDRREAVPQGELRDLNSAGEGVRVVLYQDRGGTPCRRRSEGLVKLADVSKLYSLNLDAQGAAGFVESLQCQGSSRVVRVQEGCDARDSWNRLSQQFDPLPDELRRLARQPGYVSSRASQTGHQAVFERVATGAAHDWNLPGGGSGRQGQCGGAHEDDVHLTVDELAQHVAHFVARAEAPAVHCDVLAGDITQIAEALVEGLVPRSELAL